MLQNLRNRASDESGFTLIELLVVILIIGILAAIALPTFLGQKDKAADAGAKSNARNMVSHVESCFTDNETYAGCNTSLTAANTGLPVVASPPGNDQVSVVPSATAPTTDYVVTATSKAGHSFIITHSTTGNARTCTPGATGGCGGTSAAGTW